MLSVLIVLPVLSVLPALPKLDFTLDMIHKHQGYLPSHTMRDLIRDNALLLPAIGRFDIAFGFGDNSVSQVCEANNVDTDTFLSVCNLLSDNKVDPRLISLPSLMAYLKRAHAAFLDVDLPKIRHHLLEAINCSETNEVALLLIRFYDDYVAEVKNHMDYENNVIFKYVEGLLNNDIDPDFSISGFSVNHNHMAAKLNELKDIFIYHYKQKDTYRLSTVLFDIINCERDLISHFNVESRLFIPAVEMLENSLREKHDNNSQGNADDSAASDNQLDLLSEREKDIIRAVAYGKANKEIADELCISVHTVATHRRNISAKLGIHTSAGLIIFAIINHLVDLNDVKSKW